MVDVELFYIEILPVWTYFSCIYECIFKMIEKIKKKTCVQRIFMFIFTEFICKDFINRDFVFCIFTTLYRIGTSMCS